MISYKRDVLERQCLSEVKMSWGSPIRERVRKKIVEYFKNNVLQRQTLQRLCKSYHLQCITSSKDSEKLEKSARKGQGRRPLLDARGLRALRCHCITHRYDSVIDITKWAQEYFQKPLSVNTICRAICWNPTQSDCFKVEKVFNGQTSPNLTFLLEITDAVSSGLKRRETFQRVISVQFKPSIADGMGVHKCIRYGQLACFGRHYKCWKVYRDFRATYAPLQTTSISGKALCISAGQCKTTYCSYYNSMAS